MGAITAGGIGVMTSLRHVFLSCAASIILTSCASSNNFAPVTDISGYEAVIQSRAARPFTPKKVSAAAKPVQYRETTKTQWSWPTAGTLLTSYSSKNKGIDIGGRYGQPVIAAASGKVVYAGGGLRGYGKLVIIKHNSQYLSAYAHNNRLIVRDGEWVKRGQIIADMGQDGTRGAVLHFEIRLNGNPVNPLKLLT